MSAAATFKTPPRPPPVSFREVSGRQRALVANVIERCDVIKSRVSKELADLQAVIQSKTVENVSRVVSPLRSGVGIVLQVATTPVCNIVPPLCQRRTTQRRALNLDTRMQNQSSITCSLNLQQPFTWIRLNPQP